MRFNGTNEIKTVESHLKSRNGLEWSIPFKFIGNGFDESCLLFMSSNQWYSQTQYSYLSISFCPVSSYSFSLKWQSRSCLQIGVLLGEPPASLKIIRPCRKSLPETNALAYFVPASGTNEKKFFLILSTRL
jgi:hypothetical protein